MQLLQQKNLFLSLRLIAELRPMITSANRTVYIVPPWQNGLRWPPGQPDDVLDYELDSSAALIDVGDAISVASACVSPYGSGELSLNSISFYGDVVTVWVSGGVAGRIYTVNVNVTTTAGREFSWFVRLPISAETAIFPLPTPPSPGYSTPIHT